MEKIKIITDSTADLPKEVYEKYDIEVLPLLINFGEESYLDGVEITPEVLFERIEKEGSLPTTAQVIPNRFMDTYKKYLDDGYKIISIHISSAMSGTYQSACIAKDTLESEDIFVIDSKNVTAALGMLVLKAAILKENGYGTKEIAEELEKIKFNIKSSILFESLDNLVRGGRISKTAGIVGSVLGIKLILEIKDGLMSVKDKIRGSKKAIKKIISDLESNDLDNDVPVILIEVDNPEVTNALETYLIEKKVNYILSPVGTTVCIHSGRKCCGLVFLNK
ncbi:MULTISPECIES: DegV family protein [Clostridium]|uniref:DegV family protein n=1 Tax=Clostridium carnis TaxID=1530 RepID=A0ABY6SWM5_9CLOT|nr:MULTISPECIES: DegV family protein [Clostridium]CAI3617234.1 putative EDD domain-containing protein, DegV family [Clostridium neonatale]CAI3686579.1 putative EDD domain-containing protein, DegV family [Clostridium neonatale]CAI3704458.1 putative EDD domain-containing protein, DegV family [Clostridium neonatale]CAI3717285.1 putative EDD domain-containing protein, DegV family [Clostridium neonatale]CAI3725731.1 putative EDD domain-containing protein, DegV family [Clostridium neonatale]